MDFLPKEALAQSPQYIFHNESLKTMSKKFPKVKFKTKINQK